MELDLELTYKNNLEFIQNNLNSIYNDIIHTNIENIELLDITNNLNIKINSNTLYPQNSEDAIKMQVSTFLQEPTCYFKRPTKSFDEGENYIHDRYVENIEKSSPYLKEKRVFSNYYHNTNNLFPMMIMFGIGSGKHIELLIKQSNIQKLIISDDDYTFLKVSMHIIDWRPIFKHFQQDGYELYFFIGKEPVKLAHSILNHIVKHYSYLLYYLPYYTHYNSDFFKALKDELTHKINLGFSGHGFYDDELMSLKHTISNIKAKIPIFINDKPLPQHSSVFIIGSGPSIDEDIKYIKKHQDKAIIFSCGTALKILHANNIVPDYHFESERTYIVYTLLTDSIPKEYLKQINFIGLNVIYPEVFNLFKTTKIFFRENDCGGSIAPDNIPHLHHCNPTAVNATLSFASEIGFKNIFLFGTDMGYKDEDYHHSKYSVYNDKCSTYFNFKDAQANKKTYSGSFNPNEQFLSNDILIWCKQRAENCITDYREFRNRFINYFNCSDGLFIDRTTPLQSSNIQLDTTIDKSSVIQSIEKNFDYNSDALQKILQEKLAHEKKVFFSILDIIEQLIQRKPIKNYSELFIFFHKTYILVSDFSDDVKHPKSSLTRGLLRGTFYHFYITIFTHALAVSNKEQSFKYINESLNQILLFIKEIREDIKKIQLD